MTGPNASTRRRGVAAVEFAVCLPILTLLLLGSIELSNFIYLKQSLTVIVYETSREAIRPNSTNESARAVANNIIDSRDLTDVAVSLPANVENIPRGERITVTVSAPSSANRVVIPRFAKGLTITATCTAVRE